MELARLKLANLKEAKKLAGNSVTSTNKESLCPIETVHNPFRGKGKMG